MDIKNKSKPNLITRILAVVVAVLLGVSPATAVADMQGIDVSSWQPSNITRLVDADLAVVKVTQATGYVNPSWRAQAQGAVDTGKALGLYHYAGGYNATAEADWFLAQIGDYVGRAVLVLDWESNQNSAWGNGGWVLQFVQRIHDRTRVWPLVYVQASAIGQIPQQVWDKCGLWAAQYANMLPTGYQSNPWNYGAYGEAMRQYTSTGRLPGYSGNLDLNVFRGERWQWDAYAQGDGAKRPSAPLPETTTGATGQQTTNTGRQCVVVQPGDSLSAIAARYGGTWGEWTGYASGNPGLIYAGETVCRGTTQQTATGGQHPSGTGALQVTVQSGDTMSGIAARYDAWPLSSWSVPSGNLNLIYPGQVVTYAGSHQYQPAGGRAYTVRSGDTLSGIAQRLGVSMSQITGYRSGNPSLIYPGEVLYY